MLMSAFKLQPQHPSNELHVGTGGLGTQDTLSGSMLESLVMLKLQVFFTNKLRLLLPGCFSNASLTSGLEGGGIAASQVLLEDVGAQTISY
jgi:hypothetical protein